MQGATDCMTALFLSCTGSTRASSLDPQVKPEGDKKG